MICVLFQFLSFKPCDWLSNTICPILVHMYPKILTFGKKISQRVIFLLLQWKNTAKDFCSFRAGFCDVRTRTDQPKNESRLFAWLRAYFTKTKTKYIRHLPAFTEKMLSFRVSTRSRSQKKTGVLKSNTFSKSEKLWFFFFGGSPAFPLGTRSHLKNSVRVCVTLTSRKRF